MGTLTYEAAYSAQNWTGTVNVNYTAVYDPDTNRTTVMFEDCTHVYFGRNLYGTSYKTEITVAADDNPSSKGAATIISASNATTNGGIKTFTDTPTPASIVVQHSAEAGEKSITISCSTSITAYMSSSTSAQTTGTGSGAATVATGTRKQQGLVYIDNGSGFAAYHVYIDNGTGWDRVIPHIDNGTGWDMCS